MKLTEAQRKQLLSEITFSASKSSGPGGQNVNKVNTQVELRFSVANSYVFTEHEKELIRLKLKNRMNAGNELILSSNKTRSQLKNKEIVIERFFTLIEKAATPAKKRIRTAPTLGSKLKRLEGKKQQSAKKQLRKKPGV